MIEYFFCEKKYIFVHYNMNTKDNILKALSSYSPVIVEENINTLRRELEEQTAINQTLKDSDYDEKSALVSVFIEENESLVSEQLDRMRDIVNNLQSVIADNHELEQNEDVYTEVVGSEESVNLANKISELKTLKNTALTFLESAGVNLTLK